MRRLLPLAALPLLAGAGDTQLIQPGKWENRVEVLDVKMPGAPAGVAEAMRRKPFVGTSCITPEQARQGPRASLQRQPGCRITQYGATGGRIVMAMACKRPEGTMTVRSARRFTPTRYVMQGTSTTTGRMTMTVTTRTSGRLVGKC